MEERELLQKKIKVLEKGIKNLEIKKQFLEKKLKEFDIKKWERRKNEGWRVFLYHSSYYGSECGVESTKLIYAFSPAAASHVNIDYWKNAKFSHGDSTMSESNKEFEKIIDSLELDEYDYLDDDIAQAVWPELYEVYKRL